MYYEQSKEFGEKMEKQNKTEPMEQMENFAKKYATYNLLNKNNSF